MKLNKKGIAIDFISGIIFVVLIIFLGFILTLIISSHGAQKEKEFQAHTALMETNYQTRTVLMQEYEGKKIYQHIVDDFNEHGREITAQNIQRILTQNNPGTTWFVSISGYYLPTGSDLRQLSILIPDFVVPNPDGQIIRVKIKVLRESDFNLKPIQ
jgi:hypothetical protein